MCGMLLVVSMILVLRVVVVLVLLCVVFTVIVGVGVGGFDGCVATGDGCSVVFVVGIVRSVDVGGVCDIVGVAVVGVVGCYVADIGVRNNGMSGIVSVGGGFVVVVVSCIVAVMYTDGCIDAGVVVVCAMCITGDVVMYVFVVVLLYVLCVFISRL